MPSARPRRCLLFVPGDQDAKMRRAAGLPCDGVILDLEDAVGADHKVEAREAALRTLCEMDFGGRERLLRINSLTSPWGAADLAAVREAAMLPDAVLVPKVDGPEQVLEVARILDGRRIPLLPAIESARGLLAAPAIAASHSLVSGIMFGDGDYLADIGGRRTPQTLLYPRSALVVAARAAGVDAIDTPYLQLGDLPGLEADALAAAELGFAGKAAIHPEQLPIITAVFTPTPEQVDWARRVLQAAAQEAHGAFVVDGVMADAMTIRTAERILVAAPLEK